METLTQGDEIHEIKEEGKEEEDDASRESAKVGKANEEDYCSENFNETEFEDVGDDTNLTANAVPVSAKADNFNMHMSGTRSKTAPRESRPPTELHNRPPASRGPPKKLLGLRSGSVHESTPQHAKKMSDLRKETLRTQDNVT